MERGSGCTTHTEPAGGAQDSDQTELVRESQFLAAELIYRYVYIHNIYNFKVRSEDYYIWSNTINLMIICTVGADRWM